MMLAEKIAVVTQEAGAYDDLWYPYSAVAPPPRLHAPAAVRERGRGSGSATAARSSCAARHRVVCC